MKQKVLVIVGPTASGKSALGVELAKRFGGEIISADSRQVYRGLDIGTGKITKREMMGIPHHLLDVASPKKTFSADDFAKRARRAIRDIGKRGKLPIIVGGTGFYIDALLGNIVLPDVPPDPVFRQRMREKSASELLVALKKIDPARAKRIAASPSEQNNKVRIIRALEIARALGKVPAAKQVEQYDPLWIGIAPTSNLLKKRIYARLDARLKAGMVAEAKQLHRSGLSYKRMEQLGLEYRSLARHLRGETSLEATRTELQSDIWRYARKQIGYWKRNHDITWFAPSQRAKIAAKIRKWAKG